MLLPLLCAFGASTLPHPPESGPDALERARAALERTHQRWAEDDLLGACQVGVEGLREGAAQLAGEGNAQAASLLADELEVLCTFLTSFVTPTVAEGHVRALLGDASIAPAHGMAHAALLHLAGREEELGYLADWEFIGPFDNERGAGVGRSLAPELNPDSALEHEGAVRTVRWRRIAPALRQSVRLRMGALLDPSTQVCVLLRTWVRVDEERDVLALLGVGDELRLWHDGEPVLDALGEHDFRLDGLAAPLRLHAGWNELAIKLGSRDSTPLLTLRLVDALSGEPLYVEHSGAAPAGVEPYALSAAPATARDASLRPGAWGNAWGRTEPENEWRNALFSVARQPLPRSENAGRLEVARAVAGAPQQLRYRTLRSIVMNDAASTRAERDAAAWLGTVRAVLDIDPELPRALVWEALHAFREQGMPRRALDLVDRALVRSPQSLSLGSLRVELLRAIDQGAMAQAQARELLARPQVALQPGLCLDLLESVPVPAAERARMLERLVELGGGARALRLAAEQRALRLGEAAGDWSLELHEALVARDPWGVQTRLNSARRLLVQDRPLDALALLDEAVELAPDRAVLQRYRARAHLQRGDEEAAIAALEAELELDFSSADERRLLEHLRASAGAPFHEAYQEPLDAVLARWGDSPPGGAAGASRDLLLRRLVVEVQPDGTAKRYQREVHRVHTESGARDLDRFVLSARPGSQQARLLQGLVRHADGSEERARTGRSGRNGRLGVDLPPIQAGDVVDLEWRLDDLRPTFFGRTFGLRSSFVSNPDLGCKQSEIVLVETPELPLVHHLRNVELEPVVEQLDDGRTRHRWTLLEWRPRRRESPSPPSEEWLPILEASSYQNWEELGSWWWNLIEEEIRVSPEMSAYVREATAELDTPLGKLRALYDFVVTEVRYNAWEFGVHGYEPYSAPVIFSRRFGDCKDKAILLRALCSEVGIECYPVLIDSQGIRAREDHSLALVQHFNHVIAYVPEQDGIPAMYLDGTARLHPLEVLPSSDLGAAVVIVRPDGVDEARIAFPPAEVNRLELDVTIDLRSDAPRARVERRAHGTFDAAERSFWSGAEQERAEVAERFATGLFGALSEPPRVETSEVETLIGPTWSRLECAPESVGRRSAEGLELPAVLEPMELVSTLASERARSTDLVLSAPSTYVRRLRYELPSGARVSELPPNVERQTEDAQYSWSATRDGGAVVVEERLQLSSQRVPPERYDALRELLRELEAAQSASIRVEVQP